MPAPEDESRRFAPSPETGLVSSTARRRPRAADQMHEEVAWYSRRWLPITAQSCGALLEQLWLTPGDRLLDVACGPGALVAEAAPIVGPFGRAVGLDWLPAMLAAGKRLARRHDLHNVGWVLADANQPPFGDGSFDAVTCTFPIPTLFGPGDALAHMRRLLCAGGRLGVAVAGATVRSPATGLLLNVLARHGRATGREDGFEAGTPAAVEGWLRDAGCVRVGSRVLSHEARRLDFADYWADVLAGRMPGTRLYRSLPAQEQASVRVEVADALAAHRSGTRLALPVEAIVAWGESPGAGRQ